MESGDGDMTTMEGWCGAPVPASNDGDKLGEVVLVVGLAPCRKRSGPEY